MDNPDFEDEDEEGMELGASQEQHASHEQPLSREQEDPSQQQDGAADAEDFDQELAAMLDEGFEGLSGFGQEHERDGGEASPSTMHQQEELSPYPTQEGEEQQEGSQQQPRQHKRRLSDDMPSEGQQLPRMGQEEDQEGIRQAEAARKRAVFDAMTEGQRNRYEAYCRSAVPRKKVKKLVQALQGNNAVNDKVLIAICSVTKMFLGDIVEKARILASKQQHEGALLPSHVRQAYALLQQEHRVPLRGPPKPLLR